MIVQVTYFLPLGGAFHTADMADGKIGYDSFTAAECLVLTKWVYYDSLPADRNKWS